MKDHAIGLQEVTRHETSSRMKTKHSKCFFAPTKMKLLGEVIDWNGIYVDDNKLIAIKVMPIPTTKPSFARCRT